uniref:Secreted protein n=1 Tax=Anopheles darlingi TaxID=43151 RepID=A0A2M4DAH8_ANODA
MCRDHLLTTMNVLCVCADDVAAAAASWCCLVHVETVNKQKIEQTVSKIGIRNWFSNLVSIFLSLSLFLSLSMSTLKSITVPTALTDHNHHQLSGDHLIRSHLFVVVTSQSCRSVSRDGLQ